MFRLILLLLGNDFARRRWKALARLGIAWTLLGVAVLLVALTGSSATVTRLLGCLLVLQGVVTLVLTPSGRDVLTAQRKARGAALLIIGLLVIDAHHDAGALLNVAFGAAFLLDGLLRIVVAVAVRFRRWWASLLTGLVEIAFAGLIFEPYPAWYPGTIAGCIGMVLFLSGCGLLRQARRLRRLPSGASVPLWLSRGIAPEPAAQAADADASALPAAGDLVVHVWTPTGSAGPPGSARDTADRHVAAVDRHGVVSTGHAALDAAPGIYISHYPKLAVAGPDAGLERLLGADAGADVDGVFQRGYAEEAAGWCRSTVQVHFERYNRARLADFWRRYRTDRTYNPVSRNCSSGVVHALEAALEGTLYDDNASVGALFRAILTPEFWVAARLYRRGQANTWIPGLVLDYARTLKAVANASPLDLRSAIRGVATLRRQAAHARMDRRAARAEARAETLHDDRER